jgi:hypothetical protein
MTSTAPEITPEPRYGYIALYQGQRWELHADSQYAALLQATGHFKPPKSKKHLVTVHLAEIDGETVTQAPLM